MPRRPLFSLEDFQRQERIYRTWCFITSILCFALGLWLGANYM